MIGSWRQSIAHRGRWPGGRFRGAAIQRSIAIDDDSDGAQIRAAFAQLPAEYQEVLILQVHGGRSANEIASDLDLLLAQVLLRLFRARRELRLRCGADMQWDPEA